MGDVEGTISFFTQHFDSFSLRQDTKEQYLFLHVSTFSVFVSTRVLTKTERVEMLCKKIFVPSTSPII